LKPFGIADLTAPMAATSKITQSSKAASHILQWGYTSQILGNVNGFVAPPAVAEACLDAVQSLLYTGA
jgi:hypothetical protein